MRVIDLVRDLRSNPGRYVECRTPIHLWAFLEGYCWVDSSLREPLRELIAYFEGPEELNVFIRAHLAADDPSDAFEQILQRLESRVETAESWPFEPGLGSGKTLIHTVGDYLRQGRSGLFLAEPTVTWLQHFVQGFLVGTSMSDPEAGKQQSEQFSDFGEWLAEYYNCPGTRWHRILRIYGTETGGIFKLPALWDEFVAHAAGSRATVTEGS
jgi:hypothetical protein